MTHRDRVGDPPGRRGAAGDAGHRQGFPTPSGGSPARPEAASQGFRTASPVARYAGEAPPHALLAENPNLQPWGKPSLWVIISETWYKIDHGASYGEPGAIATGPTCRRPRSLRFRTRRGRARSPL